MKGLTCRLNMVEERIGELENQLIKSSKGKKLVGKNVRGHISLMDNIKWLKMCLTGISENSANDKSEETMNKNFPELLTDTKHQTKIVQKH